MTNMSIIHLSMIDKHEFITKTGREKDREKWRVTKRVGRDRQRVRESERDRGRQRGKETAGGTERNRTIETERQTEG